MAESLTTPTIPLSVSLSPTSSSLKRKPRRPLLEICNETCTDLLAAIGKANAHPVDHAILAADLQSKVLLIAVLTPDRFHALSRDSGEDGGNDNSSGCQTVTSNGVDYPIVARVQEGSITLAPSPCEPHLWTTFFTANGRALIAEPKIKDEIAFRRAELLRYLAEKRHAERKVKRELAKTRKAECEDGANDDKGECEEISDEEARLARRRQKRREKDKRQRAWRKAAAARAMEIEELEREVMQDGVSEEEMALGLQAVAVEPERYLELLAEAKALGLKIVRTE